MKLSRIFADFHNADEQGRLRLNCIGTIEDLARQQAELENGQRLTLYSEDLEVDGVVQFSEEEKVWVAAIDWNQIQQVEQQKISYGLMQSTGNINLSDSSFKPTSENLISNI